VTDSDDLSSIIDRIRRGSHTEDDIKQLQQALNLDSDRQLRSQLGKYNVNIGEGKEIHIGDRIYYKWDEEAMKALIKAIQEAKGIQQNTQGGDAAGRDIDKRNIYENCIFQFITLLFGDSPLGSNSQESLPNFDFSGIPQESIQQAYQAVLPPDAGLWVLEGNDISQILKNLEECRRLPEFFICLSQDENISKENRDRLRSIAKEILAKKHPNESKDQALSNFFGNRKVQLKSYLMATIERGDNDEESFLINAWLIIEDSGSVNSIFQLESLLDKDEQQSGKLCKFNDIPKQLNSFLKKSLKYLRGKQHQLIIEIFLPSDLICTEVDRWKIDDPIADEVALGIKYPIRLRSQERLNLSYLDSYLPDWYENWNNVRNFLDNQPIQEIFEHLEEMETFTSKSLKIRLKEKIGLKVTCAPTKARTNELFKAILRAATPIAIWTRCNIPNLDQVAAINEILTFKPLCHLCESVRQTREKADAQTEEHLGFHLALLWENPYRLPPDTMWLLRTPGQ